MHAAVFSAFDAICRAQAAGGAVLEVGATPSSDTLLMLPALAAATERVGINLERASGIGGCPILQVHAHDMGCFEAGRFDVVLCNSVLEHDGKFWLSLAEMRRVAKPGGAAGHRRAGLRGTWGGALAISPLPAGSAADSWSPV